MTQDIRRIKIEEVGDIVKDSYGRRIVTNVTKYDKEIIVTYERVADHMLKHTMIEHRVTMWDALHAIFDKLNLNKEMQKYILDTVNGVEKAKVGKNE